MNAGSGVKFIIFINLTNPEPRFLKVFYSWAQYNWTHWSAQYRHTQQRNLTFGCIKMLIEYRFTKPGSGHRATERPLKKRRKKNERYACIGKTKRR